MLDPRTTVEATIGEPKITALPAAVSSDSRPALSDNLILKAVVPLRNREETTVKTPFDPIGELVPHATLLQRRTANKPDVPLPPAIVARFEATVVVLTVGCEEKGLLWSVFADSDREKEREWLALFGFLIGISELGAPPVPEAWNSSKESKVMRSFTTASVVPGVWGWKVILKTPTPLVVALPLFAQRSDEENDGVGDGFVDGGTVPFVVPVEIIKHSSSHCNPF